MRLDRNAERSVFGAGVKYTITKKPIYSQSIMASSMAFMRIAEVSIMPRYSSVSLADVGWPWKSKAADGNCDRIACCEACACCGC